MERGALVVASRKQRALVAASALVLVLVAHLVDPGTIDNGPIVCPFRRLTGVPCPGCGMTRACVALAHLDLPAALAYHPLAPAFALALVASLAWYLWRGRPPALPAPATAAATVVVLGTWAWRLSASGLAVPGGMGGAAGLGS